MSDFNRDVLQLPTVSSFNGWGVSLVDSLDTMLIMDLDELANTAITHIAQLTFDEVCNSARYAS